MRPRVARVGALPCARRLLRHGQGLLGRQYPFARREFHAMDKVCWVASIPLLVASLAIAVSEQEQRDTGG